MTSSTLLSDAYWQRAWSAKDDRSLIAGSAVGSIMIIVITFLFGLGGYVASWANLVTDPNLAFLELLKIGDNHEIPVYMLAVICLIATTMNESAVDSHQIAIGDTLISFFESLGYGISLNQIRILLVFVNLPFALIGLCGFRIISLFLIPNILTTCMFNKSDEINQLANVFQTCSTTTIVDVREIDVENYKRVLDGLANRIDRDKMVIVNLCDGNDTDGYPGISIIKYMDHLNLAYTGSNEYFYQVTTSKPVLKKLLQRENVPTSAFVEIRKGHEHKDLEASTHFINWPLMVKPSISYASISISDHSIVENMEDAVKQVKSVMQETDGGVFVESFLAGREFTAVVTGDAKHVKVYPVAERVFNPKLKEKQRILAFDRYWEGYDLEGNTPGPEAPEMYWYKLAPGDWQEYLQDMAKRAYLACGGSGYGRVDMRSRNRNDKDAYVLEVNANCGLSFGKGTSSLGEILVLCNESEQEFCRALIQFAANRTINNQ
ncbi:hypothetical protein HDV01_000310 [Terramyces sp. JEL0728]|nr:hypothetical protein HDV01_000310 [Terramyces sp. JEL0728]